MKIVGNYKDQADLKGRPYILGTVCNYLQHKIEG